MKDDDDMDNEFLKTMMLNSNSNLTTHEKLSTNFHKLMIDKIERMP